MLAICPQLWPDQVAAQARREPSPGDDPPRLARGKQIAGDPGAPPMPGRPRQNSPLCAPGLV